MKNSSQEYLSPNTAQKRTFYRIKQNFSHSQAIKCCSPTPKRLIKSMPLPSIQKITKKESDTYVISVGKKTKTDKGSISHYVIPMINSYTGKSVYHKFLFDFKIPKPGSVKLESESVLTDNNLIEFTVNSIRNWIESFILQVA